MLLKAISSGFVVGPGTYLRDYWNVLDFVVIVMGWISVGISGANVSSIRVFRVLRPLKTIDKVPGMRVIATALLRAIPYLLDVLYLWGFFFFFFALVGIQLWSGVLTRRCVGGPAGGFEFSEDDPLLRLCSFSRSQGRQCGPGYSCLAVGPNPNYGFTSFDNLGVAALTVFQVVSKEGWSPIMYYVMDVWSDWSVVYFVIVIIFGGFFMIGLALAVIFSKFSSTQEEEKKKIAAELEARRRRRAARGVQRNAALQLVALRALRPLPLLPSSANLLAADAAVEKNLDHIIPGNERRPSMARKNTLSELPPLFPRGNNLNTHAKGDGSDSEDLEVVALHSSPSYASLPPPPPLPGKSPDLSSSRSNLHLSERPLPQPPPPPLTSSSSSSSVLQASPSQPTLTSPSSSARAAAAHRPSPLARTFSSDDDLSAFSRDERPVSPSSDGTADSSSAPPSTAKAVGRLRWRMRVGFDSKPYTYLLVSLILANTLVLAMQYHGMPKAMSSALNIINTVFTSIFAVEMIFKVFAYGPRGYIRDRWNLFDGVVVVASVIELALARGNGVLSVFRAFRLFRVFRLVTALPALRELIDICIDSLTSIGYCFLLTLLLIFIFSVLGMQLFGGKIDPSLSRMNFDTFFWAFVTVFQLATAEGWNLVAWSAMKGTHWSAVIYFIAVLVTLNYILLALFQSILLQRFQDVRDNKTKSQEKSKRGDGLLSPRALSPSASPPLPPSSAAEEEAAQGEGKEAAQKKRSQQRVVRSLFLFGPSHPVRRAAVRVIYSKGFEYVILTLILASSVVLALEDPARNRDPRFRDVDNGLGIFFAVAFSIEMLLKCVALGVVGHRGAYLHSAWNVLDAFVVVVAWIDLAIGGNASLRFLRSIRALRPLRLISRSPSLKIVADSIVRSLPSMLNVAIILVTVIFIFAIFAVGLFGGKLGQCEASTPGHPVVPGVPSRADCEAVPGQSWRSQARNYDNVLNAMLVLFEVTTYENWPDIMMGPVDAVGVGLAPARDHNPYVALFFIAYIAIISFFGLGLFVGVIGDSFEAAQQQATGSALLTEAQRLWIDTQAMMLRSMPHVIVPEPKGRVRAALYRFCTHRYFDSAIVLAIVVNIVIIALEHHGQGPEWDRLQYLANIVFTSIFTAEALIKIVAKSPVWYLRSPWDRFDLFVVVTSILSLVFSLGFGVTLFRLLRVLRVFKIVRGAKGLRVLFKTLIYSLMTLWNVGAIVLLLLYVFAVAGVALFGTIRRGDNLTDQANFDNFPRAVLTLFRCMTGESWSYIMRDTMVTAPHCTKDVDCGHRMYFLYWLAFMISFYMVTVNLFIGVLLDNFVRLAEESDSGPEALTGAVFDNFADVWSRADPKRTFYIPSADLPNFLAALEPPLGLGAQATSAQIRRRLLLAPVPEREGKVHFADVLLTLSVARIQANLADLDELESDTLRTFGGQQELQRRFNRTFMRPAVTTDEDLPTVAQQYAAMIVQQQWREFVRKRRIRRERSERVPAFSAQVSMEGDELLKIKSD